MNCDPRRALLAVAEDGGILDGYPEKLEPSAGLDDGERLVAFIDDGRRAFSAIAPERVALLLPEASGRGSTHARLSPRVVIETLVRVAAANQGIPLQLMSRPTLRSALNLPKSGTLEDHLDAVGDPIGTFWSTGRGLAALAALAAGAI